MTTNDTRLSKRYNRSTENSIAGKVIAVGFLLLLIAGAYVLWQYTQRQQVAQVSAEKVEFTRLTDNTLRFTFDTVRDDPSIDSYCIVLSWDFNKAELGRRDVLIPAGGEARTRLTVDIPSRGVPVAGEVYGCSTSVPDYLTSPPEELSTLPEDPIAKS